MDRSLLYQKVPQELIEDIKSGKFNSYLELIKHIDVEYPNFNYSTDKCEETIKKLADEGNTFAQSYYALLQINAGNYDTAIKYATEATKKNNADAYYFLSECYYQGLGVEKDLEKCNELLNKAVELGSADAEYTEGLFRFLKQGENLGRLRNYGSAIQMLTLAAKKGHSKAQMDLGYMLGFFFMDAKTRDTAIVDGATPNIPKALEWLRKAAEQRNVTAMELLAEYYANNGQTQLSNQWGSCIEMIDDISTWMAYPEESDERQQNRLKVANNGGIDAQLALGMIYMLGNFDTKKNPQKAVEWWEKAAAQGSTLALNNLGHAYSSGDMGTVNTEKAKEYFKKSCELGNEQATELLMKLEGNNNSSNKKGCMGILLIPIILSIILSCVL